MPRQRLLYVVKPARQTNLLALRLIAIALAKYREKLVNCVDAPLECGGKHKGAKQSNTDFSSLAKSAGP
jgi:hypothetical protein